MNRIIRRPGAIRLVESHEGEPVVELAERLAESLRQQLARLEGAATATFAAADKAQGTADELYADAGVLQAKVDGLRARLEAN